MYFGVMHSRKKKDSDRHQGRFSWELSFVSAMKKKKKKKEKKESIPWRSVQFWGAACPGRARSPGLSRRTDPCLCRLSCRPHDAARCLWASPGGTWIRRPSTWNETKRRLIQLAKRQIGRAAPRRGSLIRRKWTSLSAVTRLIRLIADPEYVGTRWLFFRNILIYETGLSGRFSFFFFRVIR